MADEAKKEKTEIAYQVAPFHRRVFANLLDFILFAILAVGLFLGAREVAKFTPGYQENETALLSNMKESGLYHVEEDGSSLDIVSYLSKSSNDFTGKQKKKYAVDAIETFLAFDLEKAGSDSFQKVLTTYVDYRLNPEFTYHNKPYFVSPYGEVMENPECEANDETYFNNCYAPFIDKYCQNFLLSEIPGHLDLTRYEARVLVWFEIPIAYAIAGLLIYLVPPLILRRGHMTIGKGLYQISLADSRLLACSTKRFLARFAIFYFGILLLSLVTFAIPAIISVSMMAFSRHKQGFGDYMLGLYEIDTSHAKLYKSYEEIKLAGILGAKKPIDFKMEELQ